MRSHPAMAASPAPGEVFGARNLGFRASEFGFAVLRFGVKGFRVEGLGSRVWG